MQVLPKFELPPKSRPSLALSTLYQTLTKP